MATGGSEHVGAPRVRDQLSAEFDHREYGVTTTAQLAGVDAEAELATLGLVARSTLLPEDTRADLFDLGGADDAVFWHGEGVTLAGRGAAAHLDFPRGLRQPGMAAAVLHALRTIPSEGTIDGPATGAIAFSALPFDPRSPARFTIPSLVVGRDLAGRQWLTKVGPRAAQQPSVRLLQKLTAAGPSRRMMPPDAFSLTARRSHVEWMQLVGAAIAAIHEGRFDKVVIAREIAVTGNRPFVVADILRRLEALFPSCMVFFTDGFLGASPELLVSRRATRVVSHPLAGTVARSGDPAADAILAGRLLASTKDREEHRYVVDEVAAALRPLCSSLHVPDVPTIVPLRNVSHLGTRIEGKLVDTGVSALDLVAALHPTPAVAGYPTAPALSYLSAVEGFDRSCYAGPVGWMDSRGDGEWAVAVRSAEVRGNTARLFSGVGVVAASDPAAELEETQLKLQALLAALVRP